MSKIYLLIIAFSLKNAIEFAEDIPFDMNNNNEFEFTFWEDGCLFIQVDFPKKNILVLEMKSYEESMTESIEIKVKN